MMGVLWVCPDLKSLSTPREVSVLGGSGAFLGKIRSEVTKSSMKSSSSGWECGYSG